MQTVMAPADLNLLSLADCRGGRSGLVAQKLLQLSDFRVGQAEVFLRARQILCCQRSVSLGQISLHAFLRRSHVGAKAVARGILLLTKCVQAVRNRWWADVQLVGFV